MARSGHPFGLVGRKFDLAGMTRPPTLFDETKPFRFIHVSEGRPMTPTEAHASRPRVEGDREREILEAALEVLADVGYDRLTMDAVATRARASKATLYRRWNTKVGLVIDALLVEKRRRPVPDTGSLRGDLIEAFCGVGGLDGRWPWRTFSSVLTALDPGRGVRPRVPQRVIGPKIAIVPPGLRAGAGPRRGPARTSTSGSSARPSPGSCCTASTSSASHPTPRARRARHRPDHPPRRDRTAASRPRERHDGGTTCLNRPRTEERAATEARATSGGRSC